MSFEQIEQSIVLKVRDTVIELIMKKWSYPSDQALSPSDIIKHERTKIEYKLR